MNAKTYFKYLGLTVLITGTAFGSLIALGEFVSPWAAVAGFFGWLGAGIWYYKYTEKRDKCPHQQ